MKKFMVLGFVFLFTSLLHASFEEALTGGRATALDGAVTAVGQDVFSIYYNPGAIAEMRASQVGTYYGRLYGGISDGSKLGRSYTGFTTPLGERVGVGASYSRFSISDIYLEEAVGATVGVNTGLANWGLTLKRLSKKIGGDAVASSEKKDPIFQAGRDQSALSLDVGVLLRTQTEWSIGFSAANFNSPDLSLRRDGSDRALPVIRWGVARQGKKTNLSFDLTHSKFTDQDTRAHAGVEHWLQKGLVLRAGGGVGSREYKRMNGGVGVHFSQWQLDYGFMMPLGTVKDTAGTHQASIGYRFGN